MTTEVARVWVPDRKWTTEPEIIGGKTCRFTVGPGHKQCGRPAKAALARSNGWWGYCEMQEHLYGRRINDGVVMASVHPDSPSAERGFTR